MPRRLFLSVVLSLILLSPTIAFADFAGRVVGVTDGDTIKVLHNGKAEKIRLHGIDCPEKAQPFGTKAKQFTSAMVFGKMVRVLTHGRDRYGRTVADVILPDGANINQALVKVGLAWWYRQYAPHDDTLRMLEDKARKDRLGLWADPNPVPPWCYRKLKKGQSC
jgi:endonuclease YncB( thermonuclease family)